MVLIQLDKLAKDNMIFLNKQFKNRNFLTIHKIPGINSDQMAQTDPNLTGGGNACLDIWLATTESADSGIAAQNSNMIWPGVRCWKKYGREQVMLNSQVLKKAGKIEAGHNSHFF